MTVPFDIQAYASILLAVVALFLFTRERISLETSGLLVLVIIVLWFQFGHLELDGEPLGPKRLFHGFGHEALVTIASLLVLAKGLEVTGALRPLSMALARLWNATPSLAYLATMLIAAVLSMFLNNTPIVAIVLPLLISMSLKAGVSASSILMPVGFATIIGGMATTIGTSTNLLVTSISADLGVTRFEMFDFATPVLMAGSVAVVYLWLVAPRLLPAREVPLASTSPRIFEAVLRLEDDGYADGRPLSEALERTHQRMRVDRVERGDGVELARLPTLTLQGGDRLTVRDTAENLKEYERLLDATLYPAADPDQPVSETNPLTAEDQQLAEVVVTRGSALHHKRLRDETVLSRFGLHPVAIYQPRPNRGRGRSPSEIGEVMLRSADIVLVQGSAAALESFKQRTNMLVLGGRVDVPRTRRAPLAVIIMVAVVVSAAAGVLPISVAALTGVAAMLVGRCLDWRSAMEALDRRIIMLIVASLALGIALMATGGARLVAELYVAGTRDLPLAVALSGLILVTALLTEVATNNAVAVLATPIAVSVAQQLGAPVEPFVLAVLFGANMSYLTPVGYQTNLLVMSAGGYRFSDFFRVGLPLQLIMWIGLSLALNHRYGL